MQSVSDRYRLVIIWSVNNIIDNFLLITFIFYWRFYTHCNNQSATTGHLLVGNRKLQCDWAIKMTDIYLCPGELCERRVKGIVFF